MLAEGEREIRRQVGGFEVTEQAEGSEAIDGQAIALLQTIGGIVTVEFDNPDSGARDGLGRSWHDGTRRW